MPFSSPGNGIFRADSFRAVSGNRGRPRSLHRHVAHIVERHFAVFDFSADDSKPIARGVMRSPELFLPFDPICAAIRNRDPEIFSGFKRRAGRRTLSVPSGGQENGMENVRPVSEVKWRRTGWSPTIFSLFLWQREKTFPVSGRDERFRLPRGGPLRSDAGNVTNLFARTDDRMDPNRI